MRSAGSLASERMTSPLSRPYCDATVIFACLGEHARRSRTLGHGRLPVFGVSRICFFAPALRLLLFRLLLLPRLGNGPYSWPSNEFPGSFLWNKTVFVLTCRRRGSYTLPPFPGEREKGERGMTMDPG